MKLPISVLATLCAVGCEAAYTEESQSPTQPAEIYETAQPNIDSIEQFEPAPPAIAPVTQVVQPRFIAQPPRRRGIDDCPGCGLG